MEQQDELLITSLQQMKFQLPENVSNLSDINGDILQSICVQFLQKLGYNQKQINSQQKFRIAQQISEDLKKEGGIRVELQILMNPSVADLRRILIAIISRFSMSEKADQQQKTESYQEKVARQKQQFRQNTIKSWLNEDWVHPALLEDNKNKGFRAYETNVNLDSKNLQKILVIQNFDEEIKPNMFSSFAQILDNAKYIAKEKEQNNKNYFQDKQKEKQIQQDRNDMIKKNASEWQLLKKKKITKLAKQMKETVPEPEVVVEQVQEQKEEVVAQQIEPVKEEKTLFELEQEFQTQNNDKNEDQNQEDGFDLEALKQQHQDEIEEVKQKLDSLQAKMNKYENKKTQMEENYNKVSEEAENYKEANRQLHTNVGELQLLIEQMGNFSSNNSNNGLVQDVQALEQDIKQLESEWESVKQDMKKQISEQKDQVSEKREKMDQQREKAIRLENEFSTMIQDIRAAYDNKESLREQVEQLPTSIYGRQKYIRSITEITKNYEKQKDEIKKIISDVEQQEDIIRQKEQTLERYYTEFENAFNTDSKKKESLHVQIFKLYSEYRNIFMGTVKTLQDSAQVKIDIREADAKVEDISSKGFKTSSEKLQRDLQDILLENQQMQQQLQQLKQQQQQQQQQYYQQQ